MCIPCANDKCMFSCLFFIIFLFIFLFIYVVYFFLIFLYFYMKRYKYAMIRTRRHQKEIPTPKTEAGKTN